MFILGLSIISPVKQHSQYGTPLSHLQSPVYSLLFCFHIYLYQVSQGESWGTGWQNCEGVTQMEIFRDVIQNIIRLIFLIPLTYWRVNPHVWN